MNTDQNGQSAVPLTRIMLRPLGSAVPLGFFAFAMGNVLFAVFEMGWIPVSEQKMLAVVLLSYVAPLEVVPCIFAFLSRDSGAATAMGVFGAGWVALALEMLLAPATQPNAVIGVFMIVDAVAVLMIAIVAFGGRPLMGVIMFLACVRFFLVGVVHLVAGEPVKMTATMIGFVLGAVAIYGAFALLLEDVRHRTILPVFRIGRARQAMEGTFDQQLERTKKEAGVRQQL